LAIKISKILESLWEEGFFITEKTVAEIRSCMNIKGYNPNLITLHSAVNKAKILTRKGSSGRYRYIQTSNFDAQLISNPEGKKGIEILKKRGIHPIIIQVSGQLFADGHYSQAIFEAFKIINILVKKESGLSYLDGKNLMSHAFKLPSPRLRWTNLETDSDKDEQEGFMFLYMGAIVGVRNPKAHDHVIQKDEIKTLEYLSFASLLVKRIDEAIVDKNI
jgi:uncharacterized protein (TIGR02391 family)